MSALAIDTLIAAEGWDALDLAHMDKWDAAQKQQALDVAGHYLSVFTSTEQGRWILRDLVSQYLVAERVANPGDDDVTIGIRQGHQDVVRKILAMIEFARTGGAHT